MVLLFTMPQKNTRGAAGPSGIDSEGRQRFLCSKSFKTTSDELCETIAIMVRKMATSEIPFAHLSMFVASRLIPLDKNPGIRPIGVGEVLRRIAGKALTIDIPAQARHRRGYCPLQACGGITGGV